MTWQRTRLKHLCTDSGQYGLNISTESYSTTGVRLIRISDITPNGDLIAPDQGVYIDSEIKPRYTLHPGDLLLSRSGTIGKTFLVPEKATGHTFAGFLVRFRPRQETDPRFLNYACQSAEFQATIQADSITSTIQNFNADRYANIPLSVPILSKQRRIADFLDIETSRIDAMLDFNDQLLGKLVERRAAGITHEISGQNHQDLKNSSLPWLSTIPNHWNEIRLSLVARMGSGHTPSRSHPEWWIECNIPWVTTGEVKHLRDDRVEELYETRECISELGLSNSAAELHPKGTVFLCRTASAGYSGIMGRDMATSQDFATWTCEKSLSPYYLLWCLRAMRQDLLGRLAIGSTHKTIYVPDLQMLRIPLPPREEQDQIVSSIRAKNSDVDAAVDAIRQQSRLLTERRQALITAAVTGQFDVSTASGQGLGVL